MQQGLLSGYNPSDALPAPRYTGMLLPIERDMYGNKGNFEMAVPQFLQDAYSGINKFGQVFRGELSPQEIQQLAFDTSLNVAGGGLLGSKLLPNAVPEGALGMNMMRPLTKDQIDPLGFGSTKGLLTRPLTETNIDITKDVNLIPEKKINIEDLQGSVLFPLIGDQSATGLLVNSIDDKVFKNPVKLEGGANFMRGASQKAEGSAWASGKSVITDINNRVKRVAEETGLPVKMIYTAMGKDAVDFATFPASVLAEQIPFSKILKKSDVVFFHGEIGVGKTTFIRHLINSFQVNNQLNLTEVTSPTFNLVNEYDVGIFVIEHYDLYRLINNDDTKNIGLLENQNEILTLIEWPEKIYNKIDNKIDLFFEY